MKSPMVGKRSHLPVNCSRMFVFLTSVCRRWMGSKLLAYLPVHKPKAPFAIVMITTYDLDEYVYNALRAGARGFVLKDAGPELLGQAIHAAANGDALISPSVTARLLSTFARGRAKTRDVQPLAPLTEREEEALTHVSRGLTNAEIGDEMHVSLSTVKTHIASLMNKLDVRNRVELAIWAHETGRV